MAIRRHRHMQRSRVQRSQSSVRYKRRAPCRYSSDPGFSRHRRRSDQLPNICVSVLFQVLNHHSKVYCLHKGARTLDFALREGTEMLRFNQAIWIFSSSPVLEQNGRRVNLEILEKKLEIPADAN